MKSEVNHLFDCSKEKLTSLLRSHGVAAGRRAKRKHTMQNTKDLPAENNASAIEYDIHDTNNYCRMLREYDDYLEDARHRGLGNKECDYIMTFLNWLLVHKDTTLTVKDLHGELRGEIRRV